MAMNLRIDVGSLTFEFQNVVSSLSWKKSFYRLCGIFWMHAGVQMTLVLCDFCSPWFSGRMTFLHERMNVSVGVRTIECGMASARFSHTLGNSKPVKTISRRVTLF